MNASVQIEQLPSVYRLARYLSCYDFRCDVKELSRKYGAHERAIRRYIQYLRGMRPGALSVIVWEPFGLEYSLAFIEDRVEEGAVRRLADAAPYLRFVKNLYPAFSVGGSSVSSIAVFLAPRGYPASDATRVLEGHGLRVVGVERCLGLPVYSCPFIEEPGLERRVSELEAVVEEWRKTGFEAAYRLTGVEAPKPKSIGLLFATVLDTNPLILKQELVKRSNLESLVPSSVEWPRLVLYRYGRRLSEIYTEYSRARILGRVVLWGLSDNAPMALLADRGVAPLLHYLASGYSLSNGILVCEEHVFTVIPARLDTVKLLRVMRERGVQAVFVESGWRLPVPLEKWDAQREEWRR